MTPLPEGNNATANVIHIISIDDTFNIYMPMWQCAHIQSSLTSYSQSGLIIHNHIHLSTHTYDVRKTAEYMVGQGDPLIDS